MAEKETEVEPLADTTETPQPEREGEQQEEEEEKGGLEGELEGAEGGEEGTEEDSPPEQDTQEQQPPAAQGEQQPPAAQQQHEEEQMGEEVDLSLEKPQPPVLVTDSPPKQQPSQKPNPPAPVATTTAASTTPARPEGPQEKKAREFIEQAERKVRSSEGFFGGLFGRAQKLEDAADLYVRAGNTYKVAKRSREAGDAFRQAAELHMKLDTKHEAATHLVEAGQVMKKEIPHDAVDCYQRAIEIYTDMGRFSLAARYHSTCAEIYEVEIADHEKAISHYEHAADFFKGEDSLGSANKCLLKVAHMCALLQHYDKAAQLFEEIGRNSLENRLLQYGAKDHFFKAAICHFCQSPLEARGALDRYKALHPAFESSREYKFITELLNAHEEQEPDKFADVVKDYDSISRIDQWLTAILLHIKRSLTAEPDIN